MDAILHLLSSTASTAYQTIFDVLPIVAVLFGFQYLVVRKKLPNLRNIVIGFIYVLAGLTLFLVGLEAALFPLGKTMAAQLTDPEFLGAVEKGGVLTWIDYGWVYTFAAAIGFSTTIAEPSLIAVALKAEEISGGSINSFGLRIAVAIGVAAGVSLGSFRIVTGTPLPIYIIVGYIIVILQTLRASKTIIPLAYDSGGVTTSTVTVPVVAALGLGLASTIEGRSPLLDGFGLIAFASLFPIMSVMGYASLTGWQKKRTERKKALKEQKDSVS
ncbi:MAG: DUF1538 domain-containing protein [Rhodospirillales bacterium]|nr:DUF1538 domain-containing protein [Rhodospirillales bacterium]